MVEEINTKITTLQKISKIDTKPHNFDKTNQRKWIYHQPKLGF